MGAADPAFAALSPYFNSCRMLRNECEYDVAGGVSDTDVDQLLQAVRQFAMDVETWIAMRHPTLA
jgi:hypothetical protein